MQIQQAIDKIKGDAIKSFEAAGGCGLVAFISGTGRGIAMAPFDRAMHENRHVAMYNLGKAVASKSGEAFGEPLVCVTTSEAWVSIQTKEDVEKNGYKQASKDPKRKEVFFVAAMDKEGNSQIYIYDIIRKGKKVKLKESEVLKDAKTHQSTLLNEFWKGYMGI